MKYQTKELEITVHPKNILEMCPREMDAFSVDEVENNLAMLKKAANNKKAATLVHVPNIYIKKKLLKRYSDVDYVISTALLVNSFASKLIGNLFISVILRFNSRQVPTKLFTNKGLAIKWLEKQLEKKGL